jgi:uncharacterized protein
MYKARRTTLEIYYKGVNISKDITKDLVSFTYTDNESGKADDIDITLQDRDGKWAREWFPTLTDKITAKILYESDGRVSYLDCGTFELDQFDNSGSSSGTTVSFKGVSVPQNNTVRRTAKNRAWESVRLSEIATDVCNTGQLRLTYATPIDPLFERTEQNNKSDLSFLQSLCEDIALSIKVTKDQVVIFNRDDTENKDIVGTLIFGSDEVKSWSFTTQCSDTYSESTVEYTDPKTGKKTKVTEKDETKPNGKVLKQTKRVENTADAQRQAAAHLKNKNRKETTGTIVVVGNVKYVAGSTIDILGFGKWDGKFYINTATHSVANGYETSLEISSIANPKEEDKTKTKAKAKAEASKKPVNAEKAQKKLL